LIKSFHRDYYEQLEKSKYLIVLHQLLKDETKKVVTGQIINDLKAALATKPKEVQIAPISAEVQMEFLVNNKLYSDLILVINGERLFAHRALLHGRSSYFRAMFESGMAETKRGQELELMTDKPAEVWLEILRFIYTDNCIITGETASTLLEMADLYNLTKLTSLCERYLASTLNEENVWSVYQLGIHRNATQLITMCIQFIIVNMDLSEIEDEDLENLRNL